MKDILVAAYQMNVQPAKKEESINKVLEVIRENHRNEIDLWIFPELFSTGFSYGHF